MSFANTPKPVERRANVSRGQPQRALTIDKHTGARILVGKSIVSVKAAYYTSDTQQETAINYLGLAPTLFVLRDRRFSAGKNCQQNGQMQNESTKFIHAS